jgi:hypothetical protein
MYIINSVKLHSGQHVLLTQGHLQAFKDVFILLQTYSWVASV